MVVEHVGSKQWKVYDSWIKLRPHIKRCINEYYACEGRTDDTDLKDQPEEEQHAAEGTDATATTSSKGDHLTGFCQAPIPPHNHTRTHPRTSQHTTHQHAQHAQHGTTRNTQHNTQHNITDNTQQRRAIPPHVSLAYA
eukprot:5460981-Pyramimonas_sp.AAC.1